MSGTHTTRSGVPTDGLALVRRYRDALAEAFEKLAAFGYRADADEIAQRYGFVYIEPKPEVRLSSDVPPAERLYDEHTR
jgi:hypothetical protein